MSYGTEAGVLALVPRYGNGGVFTTSTRPTLAQVTGWLAEVTAILNLELATAGFSVPITDTDVTPALDHFVNQEVAAIAEGVNGSGRFGPTTKKGGGKGRFALMQEDVQAFVNTNAVGFTRLGATRDYSVLGEVVYRDGDESGDAVPPLFERKGFGDSRKEWDA